MCFYCADALQMLVVDVYNHRFRKIFSPNDSLMQIMDLDDIFVFVMTSALISRFLLIAGGYHFPSVL